MENLPYREQIVETPVGVKTAGKAIDAEVSGFSHHVLRSYVLTSGFKSVCGVTILRSCVLFSIIVALFLISTRYSGGPLERGLERVINDVPMGSLLVQSDSKSGEPLLLHVMLPICIRERHRAEKTWVFLLDAQV